MPSTTIHSRIVGLRVTVYFGSTPWQCAKGDYSGAHPPAAVARRRVELGGLADSRSTLRRGANRAPNGSFVGRSCRAHQGHAGDMRSEPGRFEMRSV